MSVNKVILVGRLGRDPETRFTSGGQAVANFSLATDSSYKDRNGERQKRTEWHRIVLWGKLAELAQQYLKKGSQVYLEGRIQSREWEDKRDGQKKTSVEIVVSEMKFLGGRGDAAAAGAGAPPSRAHSSDAEFEGPGPMPDEGHAAGPEITDEDIPF
ncbi:MAG: single-stranded DNA-binding protein [Candidatus Acidiferrales bacterium]